MCGIAGIIKFDGEPVRLDELRAMTDAMIHRGPDDDGFFHTGAVGIGMRRLSIIDVGGGHQPISNEDGTLWVVMNGEIYNFVELRRSLERRGHVFKTNSDTEVILHLYEEKGVQALHDLNGMFGFALWDGRRRALWVVRDRLGIKPLFYSHTPERLVFASDVGAVRAIVPADFSRAAFLQYLALAYVPSPDTMFKGIYKLPPAHFLWVQRERVEQHCYWRVGAYATWRGSAAEAREELASILSDAVKLQLRSDVPLGIFLSGGLDSSAVAALASTQLSRSIQTLTIDFRGKGSDDARFARMVSDRHGLVYRESTVGVVEAAQALEELIPRLDEPLADSAIIPSYMLSQHARAIGLKVILTGAGGDEIFGGYARYWPSRMGSPGWVAERFSPLLRRAIGSIWQFWQPDRGLRAGDPLLSWAVGISGVSLDACSALLSAPDAFIRMRQAIAAEFAGLPAAELALGRTYGRMSIDREKYLVENVLAVNDKTTMAASVEGRVPLLDHRLVEFAFALPPEINFAGGQSKGLLREVMSGLLPGELLTRRKDGFNAPMHIWLEGKHGLNVAAELLDSPSGPLGELVAPKALETLLRNPRRRRAAANTLFALFIFNRWYKSHVG